MYTQQRQANELRTELSNYKAQVAELEAALSKVELADRLGCTANDLKPHKMNCPVDKLGQVIGKGGSNLKKLESKTGCLVDIDKVNNQIHLQGNETSIEKAIAEIENIILAVEIEMKLDKALFHFLFAKVSLLSLFCHNCLHLKLKSILYLDLCSNFLNSTNCKKVMKTSSSIYQRKT